MRKRLVAACAATLFVAAACAPEDTAPATDAMRTLIEGEVRGAVSFQFGQQIENSQWFTARVAQQGVFAVQPNPNSEPWYVITLSDAGAAKIASSNADGVLRVASISYSDLECWRSDEIRNCAADVSVAIAPTPDFQDILGPDSFTVSGRMTSSYNPRVGAWRVTDARFSAGDLNRRMRDEVLARIGPQITVPPEVFQSEILDAVDQSFDFIEEQLRPEVAVDGDVVRMPQLGVEFLRKRVRGGSWQAISDACESETTAGGGWRLAQRHEFDPALRRSKPIDTPDRRIWGDVLRYAEDSSNRYANSLWFNSFFWHGRSERLPLDGILAIGYGPRGRMLWVDSAAIAQNGSIEGYGGNIPEPPERPFSLRTPSPTDEEEAVLYRGLARQTLDGQPGGICIRQAR